MSPDDIIRAWKDENYRNSLNEDQRSQLPEHPASWVELTDVQLEGATGGKPPTRPPRPKHTSKATCPDPTIYGPDCPTSIFAPTCSGSQWCE